MPSHAILMHYPPEAHDEHRYGVVEVLATGAPAELEKFLTDYRERYHAACSEWSAWDDSDKEWDATFDAKDAELRSRYNVSTTVPDVKFEILPIGVF
jgi:hypothetical protein